MKKTVIRFISIFLVLLFSFMFVFVSAASYEYIIDNSNLFDDSNDMISMAKEIRNKLDFDIHIYSVNTLDETEEIINQYVQNSSALLIFISEEEEMCWYAGSSVQHVIRDVDFENLFSNVTISKKHYTNAVNFILSKILSIYVYEEETIDDYSVTSKYNDTKNQSWIMMNINYCINFIRQHPIRILIVLALLVACVIYYESRSRRKNSNNKEDQ